MTKLVLLLVSVICAAPVLALDQQHAAWDRLLKKHVILIDGGIASRVDYRGLVADRAGLDSYTRELSAVTAAEFGRFDRLRQMAFLINAYNAFTVELVLSRYPNLRSIRDLGGLLSSPWKQPFFTLLGEIRSLDRLEDMLRARELYGDPRIHFAINCASIGCPMLREEAYVGDRLDGQLDDAMRRFLSDRTRNLYDPASRHLQVSKIFDWYGNDFGQGRRGFGSVAQALGRFADQLADQPEDRQRISSGQAPIDFLDYDWSLNDARR